MKLTIRKKVALLGVIGIIFLTIFVIITINIKGGGTSLTSRKEQSLSQAKQLAVKKIKDSLDEKSIKETDLLTELKKEKLLKPNENDWKNCFNLEVNSLDKLNDLKKKVLTVINNLPETPSPNPSNPQNPTPSPNPTSETPPTDKWEKILWEIRKFMDTNPTSLQEIKDWVKNQNYPDPLAGVDLKGASAEKLKLIPDRGPVPGIDEISYTNPVWEYKDYVQLSAAGDGNCFMNSFSVLLTGRNNDASLAMPLKVKLCLEFILTEGFHGDGANIITPDEMKDKINGSEGFAKPGAYLESADIVIYVFNFKKTDCYGYSN